MGEHDWVFVRFGRCLSSAPFPTPSSSVGQRTPIRSQIKCIYYSRDIYFFFTFFAHIFFLFQLVSSNLSQLQDNNQYCPVTSFVGHLLRLLLCANEKFGAQIQKHVKELVGHEMAPALYPILFDQIKAVVEKFFDHNGQVVVNESHTQFIEHVTFIMKNVLENSNNKNDQPAEHLGVTSIEGMMLAIVR